MIFNRTIPLVKIKTNPFDRPVHNKFLLIQNMVATPSMITYSLKLIYTSQPQNIISLMFQSRSLISISITDHLYSVTIWISCWRNNVDFIFSLKSTVDSLQGCSPWPTCKVPCLCLTSEWFSPLELQRCMTKSKCMPTI